MCIPTGCFMMLVVVVVVVDSVELRRDDKYVKTRCVCIGVCVGEVCVCVCVCRKWGDATSKQKHHCSSLNEYKKAAVYWNPKYPTYTLHIPYIYPIYPRIYPSTSTLFDTIIILEIHEFSLPLVAYSGQRIRLNYS